jgi:hypothetical protein
MPTTKRFPTPHWICQTCKRPMADGFFEIINVDPSVGEVGGHPVEPSEDDFDDDGMPRRPRIAFHVHHDGDCTVYAEREGYWTYIQNVVTADRYMALAAHVAEKTWMSRYDLQRMLHFWWNHKGEHPPTMQ